MPAGKPRLAIKARGYRDDVRGAVLASGSCRMRMSERSRYREYVSGSYGAGLSYYGNKKGALKGHSIRNFIGIE